MGTLGDRKRLILDAVVKGYVDTAEPIGSEWLFEHHDFGCKSATIRNELSEMSDGGYLSQPHTSAGRIPTNLGYRFFVDELMRLEPYTAVDSSERMVVPSDADTDSELLVQEACRILAGMTQYPSVASPPTRETARVQRVYLAPASPRHVLLVMLVSTGHVENRVIEAVVRSAASVERVMNYLNDQLAGRTINEAALKPLRSAVLDPGVDRSLLARAHACIAKVARGLTEDRLFVEGASLMLRQREFQNVLRLEAVLTVLSEHRALGRAFLAAYESDRVAVLIGPEHAVSAIDDCSVVASAYGSATTPRGFIGVIGPTRMQYARTVSAVEMVARGLSDALSRSSLT